MWAAASSDLIATHFHVALNDVTYWLRTLLFIGPVLGFIVARRLALALQRKDREIVLHGREAGIIEMSPEGAFSERHEEIDEYRRYLLTSYEDRQVLPPQADRAGHINGNEKRRGALSKFFFEDRVAPVTPKELAEAHAAHGHTAIEVDDKKSIGR